MGTVYPGCVLRACAPFTLCFRDYPISIHWTKVRRASKHDSREPSRLFKCCDPSWPHKFMEFKILVEGGDEYSSLVLSASNLMLITAGSVRP